VIHRDQEDVTAVDSELQRWALLNSIVQFQGRYVADSIQILRAGLPEVDIHVDNVHTIEPDLSSSSGKRSS
jgi:hypothetical protein